MRSDFGRTIGALERESPRRWVIALTLGVGLTALWGGWLCLAEFWVTLSTDQARLEVAALVHPVRAEVGGRVRSASLDLGQPVRRGDVLLELESEGQRLAVEEAEARVLANDKVVHDLERLITAEQAVIRQVRLTSKAAVDETTARADQAEIAARFSKLQAERWGDLHEQGLTSEIEFLRRQADAEGQHAEALAARLASKRLAADHEATVKGRDVEIARLKQQISEKQVELVADRSLIRRLRVDSAKRTTRAPVDGTLGWVGDMSVGLVVNVGEPVATVVPSGGLRIVAHFAARQAMGRIRAGQTATLRLNAYPWAQYGVVTGRVARVASEHSENRLRVEVEIDAQQSTAVPREHGLTGSLEIAVERVTPLALLLRSVGTFVAGPAHRGPESADERQP